MMKQMGNIMEAQGQNSYHQELQCILWEAYKDAHGIRPRGMDMQSMSVEEILEEIKRCGDIIEREEDAAKAAEPKLIALFEEKVKSTMQKINANRHDAIKVMMAAEGAYGDVHYFKYLHELPYTYNVMEGTK
jgi:hypothetical protein